jgi:hypothetical protein
MIFTRILRILAGANNKKDRWLDEAHLIVW